MANTSFTKKRIEPYVQSWLSGQFPGHAFEERPVNLASGGSYKFDAVSEDGSIVATILSNRPKTRTDRENTGGVKKALTDVGWLKVLSPEILKIMVFTDSDFCGLIRLRAKRLGIEQIQMLTCPLPSELNVLLEAVLDKASNEQRAAEKVSEDPSVEKGHNPYYPVFLAITGRPCLVIGGGEVAERKVEGLLAAGGEVTLISPSCTGGLRARRDEGLIRWLERLYQPGDLAGVFLAIAATDETPVNEEVAREAQELGTLLNVVDVTPLCNFIAPSIIRRGPVTLAISTGGASPALAKRIRIALEESDALEYTEMVDMVAEVRAELRARGATVDPEAWQEGLNREVLGLHQSGRRDEARALLLRLLEGATHGAGVTTS